MEVIVFNQYCICIKGLMEKSSCAEKKNMSKSESLISLILADDIRIQGNNL